MSLLDLQEKMQKLKLGDKISSYTGVSVDAGIGADGKKRSYFAGSTSGYVLEVENPFGSQQMAVRILASLKARGASYQPFTSTGTLIDPAAELGDSVTVRNKESVIWAVRTKHGALMEADVSAPGDEEVNHEFKYKTRQSREFTRESAYTRARLTITGDRITSEVTRLDAENRALGSRIDQRLDSITLSVTSVNGSSTFTLRDGTTTLDTKTLDLTVESVNVHGQLSAEQIAAGAISIGKLDTDAKSKLVTESSTITQYYLSTSSSSATGGSWSSTIPTWQTGKYIWVRERTGNKTADNVTSYKYSPNENGRYDANLTTALSTATSAQQTAFDAQSQSATIYHSASGGTRPTAPTGWVTDTTGEQNKWTLVRPDYSASNPALYTATQSLTVGGDYSCSTPRLDSSVSGKTVIDGGTVITGRITASQIAVDDLSAFNATIGGWSITESRLEKETDNVRVRLNAFANPDPTWQAFNVAYRESVDDPFDPKFYVQYNGKMYAKNAVIAGQSKIGGVTLGEDEQLYIGTDHVTEGINTDLGYAANYGDAISGTSWPNNFSAATLYARSNLYINYAGRMALLYCDSDGNVKWRT